MDDISKKISEYVEKKQFGNARDLLMQCNSFDIAELLRNADKRELIMIFRLLPKDKAAEVFSEMEGEARRTLVESFSDSELSVMIDSMYCDDIVDLIEEMPASVVTRILRSATPETRSSVNYLLRYEPDSAGGIMTTEFIRLDAGMTSGEAISRIRKEGTGKETVYTCYVTSVDRRMIGVVTVRELLLSPDDRKISEIMNRNVISVYTSVDREEVATAMKNYGFMAMPVVDNEGRLVGIVTYDDAMDVLSEEGDEDISIMAAITPTSDGGDYLHRSAAELWRSRIPWLMLLMVSATFTSLIIASFEKKLSALVVLTAYIPMLMDTGGNCGSQASVTVIRGISTGEIRFSNIFTVMWKEFKVSLLCGITLSVTGFIKLCLVDMLLFGTEGLTVPVIAVICLTLTLVVITAKIIGCTLPLVAKKLGFDPAVMASPFITTIVDAAALLVYFGFSSLILDI